MSAREPLRPIGIHSFKRRSYHQRPVIIHSFTWRQIKLCDDGGSVVGVGGFDVVEVLLANLRRHVVEVGAVAAVSAASNVGPHVPVAFGQFGFKINISTFKK